MTNRDEFFRHIETEFGDAETATRKQILEMCAKHNIKNPVWFFNEMPKAGRGVYYLRAPDVKIVAPTSETVTTTETEPMVANMALAVVPMNPENNITHSLIPTKATGYVPFGNFNDVRAIIKSGRFYPMYITGLSGNGKTMMVEQVCAAEKRECIRVNITIETDEDDLIGGFRLQDGKTVWQNGPVVHAMERGAILLLDEVDLGSNKLMCLQPVLEGKPIFLKKINKLITPAKGFNIVATANTKGKGSDDGRFVGTNVMNEAFLERFSVTMEQEYPQERVEKKILSNLLSSLGSAHPTDADFISRLVSWADVIRKSFAEGAVSDIISTRRLVHICEAYVIFSHNREKAINLCLNRFDVDTKNSFMDLYKKLDETINPLPAESAATTATTEEVAF